MFRFPPSFLARKKTHALTAKHLHDPILSNRAFEIFFGVASLIALALLLAPKATAANGLAWGLGATADHSSNGVGMVTSSVIG